MMQAVVVCLCLTAAVAYASWRIKQALQKRSDPCYGCSGCKLKNEVCDKKVSEKFGQSK